MAQFCRIALAGLTGAVLSGSAATAQLARPDRECTPEEIELALAGDYSGPPCRFTQMPPGARPAPTEARLAGAPPRNERPVPQARPVAERIHSGPAEAAVAPARVVLDDNFFASSLAGGVERPYRPLYSYRGIILIAADGEVRTGFAGLGHRIRTVRAIDAPAVRPPRAYPYN
ncbi:hypothetical protein [Maricaulis sp.]|uniref:hypothetical protein n=1 Tax=Maricaulis sp. TaxID=1486257 RepID=UPI0026157F0D|nr:hypothetical protein [Maricaulis sp.]